MKNRKETEVRRNLILKEETKRQNTGKKTGDGQSFLLSAVPSHLFQEVPYLFPLYYSQPAKLFIILLAVKSLFAFPFKFLL